MFVLLLLDQKLLFLQNTTTTIVNQRRHLHDEHQHRAISYYRMAA